MEWKKFVQQIALVLIIVCIATAIDFAVHSIKEEYSVPFDYFTNKIIFAAFWGMVVLIVFHKTKSVRKKAILFSAIVSIILQTRYFFQGYEIKFVFLFMILHFFMFLIPAWIIFNYKKEVFSRYK